LKKIKVPEVEPEPDEIEAYREGMKEFRAGNYVEWNKIKNLICDSSRINRC
jgi:hypothetical protein